MDSTVRRKGASVNITAARQLEDARFAQGRGLGFRVSFKGCWLSNLEYKEHTWVVVKIMVHFWAP